MILLRFLLLSIVLLATTVFAEEPTEEASQGITPLGLIQGKLDNLGAHTEGENVQLRETYQQTLKYLQDQERFNKRAEKYSLLIRDFTERSESINQQIENYLPEPLPKLSRLSASEIEQLLAVTRARLLNLKNKQDNYNNELALIGSRRLVIPELISKVKETQEQIIEQASEINTTSEEMTGAQKSLSNAHLTALVAQANMLKLELLSSNNQQTLFKQQLNLLGIEIDDLTQVATKLQEQLADVRRQEAEKTVAESKKSTLTTPGSHPLLRQQAEENERLSEKLTQITIELDNTVATKQITDEQSQKVSQKLKRIKRQLQWLSMSSAFGQTLRAELASLPELPDLDALLKRQGEIQFFTYDLEQESELLTDPNAYVQTLAKDADPILSSQEQQNLVEIINARATLVSGLLDSYRSLLSVLSEREVAAQGLFNQIHQFKELIDQRLLWVPNTGQINFERFPLLQRSIQWMFSPSRWQEVVTSLMQSPKYSLGLIAASGLLLVVWFFSRRRLAHLQNYFAPLLGNVRKDKFSYTLHLMIAGAFYALPLPLFFQMLGRILLETGGLDFAQGLGQGLLWLSLPFWAWITLRNWSATQGLLKAHLQWSETTVIQWARQLRRLIWFSSPLLLMISISEWVNTEAMRSTLGRACFIIWCLGLSLFFWRALRSYVLFEQLPHPSTQQRKFYNFVRISLALTPLFFGAFALYGYFYTGLKLLSMLMYSLLIGIGWIVIYSLAIRGLLVQERRIAFEQAKARRAEILAQRARDDEGNSETSIEIPDESQIDLKAISEQTRGLVKTLLWIGVAVSLWTLWSPLFSALDILDTITVWETTFSLNGTEHLQPITLKAFLFATATILVIWISVRNLPGVMQLLVLQHLQLSPGTGYAITTLLNYSLIAIGLVVSFNIIGFKWENIQWLVAALGVGLGFGLQEIFANFISGLIILFEKPIRIGDTVTINGLTGTVSKIQIRATTIVDWDRKEIIVPNKAFITEQLVNWSLSDQVTRVRIPVGVAYGSDNELVERLLLEATNEVPSVLDTPKSEAYFVGFGDSTLNYELRIYVSEMADRLPVTHALHNLIDKKFRQHGVEIAFPQMDITIKRAAKQPVEDS
ncbi:mechanosensitive ion channel domain-containing protein [Motiliproteus sp. MSK22-1]|uniref:mechanosensitive ion channel domain-containing protein n=1 Tax=Motiliproteus sp. MSK22-1 TaxID=1897630 RepID=UPI0009762874|nr:mechanosensitive ion channel domain-containing protein [Motiliproteus sp. MSK22-1]OMH32612.1 hypothetical protein BGP75_13755 [Motiliproteus sp. MSK22-1]